MNDKKIAVYYIATGDYKTLFPEFLESVQNFFPNCDKVVKVISDGLEEYSNYVKGRVKVELCPRINHYPWPIITLYKMWHIKQNADYSCDYACYCNGNSIIYNHDPFVFSPCKITVSFHSFNRDDNPYIPWDYISIDQNSSAYLDNYTYDYVQAAFFFGPSKLFYKMCDEITDMVFEDTRKYMFAQWHDESYLNKWCVLNKDLVDKKSILTAYSDTVDSHRFIFLRNKDNYFNKIV